MRAVRSLVHVSVSLLLVITSTSSVAARSLGDDELADSVRFRTEFGFMADRAHIEAVAASPEANINYGVPLSAEEAAEMDRRVAVEQQLTPLGEFLARVPEFGGAYIDQAAGHVLVIGFVGDPAIHAAMIESLLPAGARIELRQVANSERALREVQKRVDLDRTWLRDNLGIEVFENPLDIRANRVEIGVSQLSPEIEADLRERYGDSLRAYVTKAGTVTACTSRNACTDAAGSAQVLRGGTQLFDMGCSNAFFAYQGSTYYTLTAGHSPCALGNHTYQHPNNANLGAGVNRWFVDGASADSGIVQIPASKASRRVYITASSYYPMLYVQQRGSGEWVGMTVCLSGRQRGEGASCGQLAQINFSFFACEPNGGACANLANQRSATYTAIGGDSGGAVFTSNIAVGIQSSVNQQGRGIYGHITYALSHFGLTLCTTCP